MNMLSGIKVIPEERRGDSEQRGVKAAEGVSTWVEGGCKCDISSSAND